MMASGANRSATSARKTIAVKVNSPRACVKEDGLCRSRESARFTEAHTILIGELPGVNHKDTPGKRANIFGSVRPIQNIK